MRSYTTFYLVTFGIVATLIAEGICISQSWGRPKKGDFLLYYERVTGVLAQGFRFVNYTGPTGANNKVRISQIFACDGRKEVFTFAKPDSGGVGLSFVNVKIEGAKVPVDYEVYIYGVQNGVTNPPVSKRPSRCF